MIRRYSFKMMPNAGQRERMFEMRFLTCQLYNAMVEQRRDAWDRRRKSLTRFDQGRECTKLRHEDARYKQIGAVLMERCAERVDQAFKKYFDNVKLWRRGGWQKPFPPSPPGYQRTADFSGFGFREHPKGWKFLSDRVRMQSVDGFVRIAGRFPCQPDDIRTCDIMYRDGNWWISIVVNLPEKAAMRAATGRFYGAQPSNSLSMAMGYGWIGPSDPHFEGGAQDEALAEKRDACLSEPPNEGRAQGSPRSAPVGGCPSDPQCGKASIHLTLDSHLGWLECDAERFPITIPPAKAKTGPRGARNRRHRQALAIRRRDFAFHEFTTWLAETFDEIHVSRPKLKHAAETGKGDAKNHGALVEWKAAINRDFLDWGAGKFCELLSYKMGEREQAFDIVEYDDHRMDAANAVVDLAKVSKRAKRIAKRAGKGAMHVPTRRKISGPASNHPDKSVGKGNISHG